MTCPALPVLWNLHQGEEWEDLERKGGSLAMVLVLVLALVLVRSEDVFFNGLQDLVRASGHHAVFLVAFHAFKALCPAASKLRL